MNPEPLNAHDITMNILSTEVLILAPCMMLAYINEAIIGFGASSIVVTLGANFIPIDFLVPILLPLNAIMPATIAFRHRQDIDRKLLLAQIFPFMGVGLAIGVLIYPLLKGVVLTWLLGLIVIVVSSRQLCLIYFKRTGGGAISRLHAGIWQVMAGIIQALYMTGGLVLTYSVSRLRLPKGIFRATLCTVWATMNTILIVICVLNGRLNTDTLKISAPLIIFMPVGIRIGEWLHGHISEQMFLVFIYVLLLFSGLPLIFR